MSLRDRYFEALGSEPKDHRLDELLKRALETRQFEIELYWKRATYFWAFQLIAFTVLGLLFKDGQPFHFRRLLLPAPIGIVTALAGHLTARGSKFWQENWESHVDVLEDGANQRLTQVILCRRKPQFSVSRINQDLLLFLFIGWFVLLGFGMFPDLALWLEGRPVVQAVGVFVATTAACLQLVLGNRTEFTGSQFSGGDPDWAPYPSRNKKRRLLMIRRDPGFE